MILGSVALGVNVLVLPAESTVFTRRTKTSSSLQILSAENNLTGEASKLRQMTRVPDAIVALYISVSFSRNVGTMYTKSNKSGVCALFL